MPTFATPRASSFSITEHGPLGNIALQYVSTFGSTGRIVMSAVVKKWGNSLSIRIPASAARTLGIQDGSRVDIQVEGDHLVVQPHSVPDLAALLKKTKRVNRPELADFGPPVGKELL